MPETDQHLLERIAARDTDALAAFYDRHARLVYAVITGLVRNSDDAEELLQEVMLQVWNGAGSFRSELGTPKGWMVSIARNRAINLLRSKRNRQNQLAVALPDEEGSAPIPRSLTEETTWVAVTRNEEEHLLWTAVAALPEEQRRLIVLAFFEGYSHSEIADRTSIPLGTVKTRIRTGLMTLRTQLLALSLNPIDHP